MSSGPVLAAPEALKALSGATIVDLRSAAEIAERPMAPGGVNVEWNKAEGKFDDTSGLPTDKSAPIVLN